MGFLEHLQSSLILGTHLDIPQSDHFDIERINLFFHHLHNNDHSSVEAMILEGFNVDTPHHLRHVTALIYAIELKYESLALLLVNYGANIYLEDTNNASILFLALKNSLNTLAELLIEYGAFKLQTLSMKKKSFGYISRKENEALADYESLLYKSPQRENIFNIVQEGDIHNLIFFLAFKPKLHISNSRKQSLLHLAVMSGSVAMCAFLLNRGLNIDSKDKYGNAPLIYATYSFQRVAVLKLLLARGATLDQVNQSENNALTVAIRKHNFEAMYLLIEAGANINQRDGIHTALSLVHDQLQMPLSLEKKEKFRHIQYRLYTLGAHVDAQGDSVGWTALQLCINHNETPFYLNHTKKLIQLGANLDKQDSVGRTALMIASALGRIHSIKLLANNGADLNIIDHYGWSALMLAVYNNKFEAVRELILYDADINLTSNGQLSALSVAIEQKNRRIEQYLRDNGAFVEQR